MDWDTLGSHLERFLFLPRRYTIYLHDWGFSLGRDELLVLTFLLAWFLLDAGSC